MELNPAVNEARRDHPRAGVRRQALGTPPRSPGPRTRPAALDAKARAHRRVYTADRRVLAAGFDMIGMSPI